MAELPATCDFLIIGAGVAGVSLARELRARGASVAVAEATQVCGGSSALNAGGVRQQFSQPLNISLARRTLDRLHEIESGGVDLGWHQVGYLFLISDESVVPAMHASIATQNSLDVPTRWLDPGEMAAAVPGLRLDGLVGGTFCPTDGYLDPNTLVSAIAAEARAAGVTIASNSPVVELTSGAGRVTAVRTSHGTPVSPGVVVNCAGAWSNGIAEIYGAKLPITPWRSQIFLIENAPAIDRRCPYVIDFNNHKTYYHGESTSGLLAGTDDDEACTTSWRIPFARSKADVLVERLTTRYTTFDEAQVVGGWAGMLELTADENPISDWTHFDNLYTMAGFSGHGLPISPALAEQAAAVLTGAEPSLDLSPYRFDRFDGAKPLEPAEAMSMR